MAQKFSDQGGKTTFATLSAKLGLPARQLFNDPVDLGPAPDCVGRASPHGNGQGAPLNRPIPIGFDKTISQPLMIAVMTDLLELKADDMVLEIGTGLGYQSAVLAELAGTVASLPAALAALSNLLNKRDSRFFFKKPLFPDICSDWCDNVSWHD